MYQALEKTPFVSLYGSQNWVEDFAEYCTWYYFTAQLHQPYRIIISRDCMTEMIYEPMESALVQERIGTPSLDSESQVGGGHDGHPLRTERLVPAR